MNRDSIFHLCVEGKSEIHHIADIKMRFNDFSIYVEFNDADNTELHLHPTGAVVLKQGRWKIDSLFLRDPLSLNELLPVASYLLGHISEFPQSDGLSPEKIILIPREIFENSRRVAFALANNLDSSPMPFQAVGLPSVLWLYIFSMSDETPLEEYSFGASERCALTTQNLSDSHIPEDQRFLEINKKLRENALNLSGNHFGLEPKSSINQPLMVRPPNSEGVWEIIFEVPMRIAPRMKMGFKDPRYSSIDKKVTKIAFDRVSRKFQIHDSLTSSFVMDYLPEFELILDAEL